MSMIIDGTNGLTFNNATTQASAGNVLQVVTSNYATLTSTSSLGLVATGHSVTITPKFSTSKILIIANAVVSTSSTNGWGFFSTIYRNGSTNLATSAGGAGTPAAFDAIYSSTGSYQFTMPMVMQYLDSPATTSATTYAVYMGGGGATVKYCTDGWYGSTTPAVLTVLEIAA